MTFSEAVKTCFQKSATFRGRAPRSEFWWFFLFNFLVMVLLFAIGNIIAGKLLGDRLVNIYQLIIFLPYTSVGFRRLHDLNRSGWWLGTLLIISFIWLVCLFGILMTGSEFFAMLGTGLAPIMLIWSIGLLIYFIFPGTKGTNKYGSDPLEQDYRVKPLENPEDISTSASVNLNKYE